MRPSGASWMEPATGALGEVADTEFTRLTSRVAERFCIPMLHRGLAGCCGLPQVVSSRALYVSDLKNVRIDNLASLSSKRSRGQWASHHRYGSRGKDARQISGVYGVR